jgi:hypothetical protein
MGFQAIRDRNDRGVLVAAGYEWAEEKDTPGIPLYLLTCAGVVAALLGLWVALVGDAVIGTPIILAGIAVAWSSYRARKVYGRNRRALVFRADDTVVAPYGLAGNRAPGPLPVKVSDIINIALDVQYDTPYLTLSIRDGRKIDVLGSRGIEDDEGRLIHTELAKARDEIRRAMAG